MNSLFNKSQLGYTKILVVFFFTFICLSSASAQWNITINPEKTSVTAGTNLSYDISVQNSSISSRSNARVVTTLPDNVSYVTATVACDISALPVLTCPLGNMSGLETEEFTLILKIEDDYLVGSNGAGFMTLALQGLANSGSASNRSETIAVNELTDLKVSQFASNLTPRAGDVFNYSIVVDNFGPSAARNVSIHGSLASGVGTADQQVTIQSCAFSVSQGCGSISQFNCTTGVVTLGQFINDIGNMSASFLRPMTQESADCLSEGPTGRLRASFRIVSSIDLDLTAFTAVESDTPESNYENNYSEMLYDITGVSDLSVTKTATGEVQTEGADGLPYNLIVGAPFPEAPDFTTSSIAVTQGRRIRYAIRVENNGPSTAENVVITDRLPPGIVIVPASLTVTDEDEATTTGSCSFGSAGNPLDKMVCGLGSLSSTTQAEADRKFPIAKTITFDVVVDLALAPNTVLTNDVVVSSDSFEDNNSDNAATAFSVISPIEGVAGCSVGGPYENIICGSGTANLNLSGYGFALPEEVTPVSYNWSTDCPSGIFSDSSVANPTFAFTTANPDNTPVACQIELEVSNMYADSTCSGTVTVVDCSVDCNGTLGGTAALDRCGVCEGDGQSCLDCKDFEIKEQVFDLNLSNTKLLSLTSRASRMFAESAGTIQALKKSIRLRRKARRVFEAAEEAINSFPLSITSCTNDAFCVHTSNVSSMTEVSSGSASLLDLLNNAVKLLRNASGNPKAGRNMIRRANGHYVAGQTAITGIPTTSSSCS